MSDTTQHVKIQSVIRGWLVRRFLKLAGPGVLRRKDLSNDEELVTLEDASKQHPFEYFAFTENGKTFWFDFATIWRWSIKSVTPLNPYTNVALNQETRKRLRELWRVRMRMKMPVPESDDPAEKILQRWTFLCQVFMDNGFTDLEPRDFMRIPKQSYMAVFHMLREDTMTSIRPNQYGYHAIVSLCRHMTSPHISALPPVVYIINALRLLTRIVTAQKDPYITIFNVMSALYRC